MTAAWHWTKLKIFSGIVLSGDSYLRGVYQQNRRFVLKRKSEPLRYVATPQMCGSVLRLWESMSHIESQFGAPEYSRRNLKQILPKRILRLSNET